MGLEAILQIRGVLFHYFSPVGQERRADTQAATLLRASAYLPITRRYTQRLHHQSQDPILKYELRPGAIVERDGIFYRINAQGFRNDKDVPLKQSGERRIVILGDSLAFGFGVDQEQTFAHLIENKLNNTESPTRVLNLSISGYKTTQEVRLFERSGWELEPDGVVVAFCLNDFDDDSVALPLFDSSTSLPRNRFRRVSPRRIGSIELPDPIPLLDRSFLFRGITGRLLRLDYYRWISTDPALRNEVASAIDRLGHELSERGIPRLLAIFPILVDHDPYPYRDIHRFVSQRAEAAGFMVVDLLGSFSTESLPTLRRVPTDLLHFNAHGHVVTARVLAPCLANPAFHCP